MHIDIKENISLARHTIYKIGGPARFFAEVSSMTELQETVRFAAEKNLPVFVLGTGSNVLIADKGFDGLVIHMNGRKINVEGEFLTADAGITMAQAVLKSSQAALTSFEWGIGIPGTIGGSVYGNAGCFGGEMSQVVEFVQILKCKNETEGLKVYEIKGNECEFSYRDAIFKRHPEWIIISATLKLQKGDPKAIHEKIKKITAERTNKQDIGTKSCGCIFKNAAWSSINKKDLLQRFPELGRFKDNPNIPASFLIDQTGLKGRRVGGVFISPKHANYFVNGGRPLPAKMVSTRKNGATAEEVVTLIAIAKDAVKRKYGIILEEEIKFVGF